LAKIRKKVTASIFGAPRACFGGKALKSLTVLLSVAIILGALGCGTGSDALVGKPGSAFTSISIRFNNFSGPIGITGVAVQSITGVAVQTQTGSFVPASLQNGLLTFLVPPGSSKYAFAYLCQTNFGAGPELDEFVVELTTQDATSLVADCFGNLSVDLGSPVMNPGTLSGSLDASALTAGLFDPFVIIAGSQGTGGLVKPSGFFTSSLPSGNDDVALVAQGINLGINGFGSAIKGVKIFRNQTVPGMLNGGGTVTFTSNDAPVTQSILLNPPAGFTPVLDTVDYTTANGTKFSLQPVQQAFPPPVQAAAVPPAAAQLGDFYSFGISASNGISSVGVYQPASAVNGLTTLNFPAPWTSANPTSVGPSTTFTFNYPGFSGIPIFAQQAQTSFVTGTTVNKITVLATANFQGEANTITLPDLSSMGQGFLKCCPSNSNVAWQAAILGAESPQRSIPSFFSSVTFHGLSQPPKSSIAFVQNSGTFTAP
jgi:hypothetical protein